MTITPGDVARRKQNQLHVQILGALLANKTTVKWERRGSRSKSGWQEKDIPVASPTFAGNVSEENVNRLAKRWAS